MAQSYSVSLDTIVREHNLAIVNRAVDYDRVQITTWEVSRPGLPLAGFYDYFDATRVQIIGKLEITYLMDMRPETRSRSIERFISSGIRFCIVAHGMDIPPEMLSSAQRHQVTLLTTEHSTSDFMAKLIVSLNRWLAPRTTMHGVLMEVHGEGVMITGESGVGKSETAVELVKRGHRLIADDAVELRRVSDRTILGTAPENIRHFIELRGVGIINVARVFGSGAVKMSEKVDLVVELEPWDKTKNYSRTGLETDTTDIMGIQLPCTVIPVMPGRNLAVILEAAAINNRQKKMGYNAARELLARLGLDEDDPSLR